jgi:hypothetical protein
LPLPSDPATGETLTFMFPVVGLPVYPRNSPEVPSAMNREPVIVPPVMFGSVSPMPDATPPVPSW